MRQWYKVLSGCWEHRHSPAVRTIVDDVLEEAETVAARLLCADAQQLEDALAEARRGGRGTETVVRDKDGRLMLLQVETDEEGLHVHARYLGLSLYQMAG